MRHALGSGSPAYSYVAAALIGLGIAGGLFIVPLNAFLQHKSDTGEKGRLIATCNFLGTCGILLACDALWVCQELLRLSADQIILVFGIGTLLGPVYVLRLLPDFLLRFLLWLLTHTLYRMRIVGAAQVPAQGPADVLPGMVYLEDVLSQLAPWQKFWLCCKRACCPYACYSGFIRHMGSSPRLWPPWCSQAAAPALPRA